MLIKFIFCLLFIVFTNFHGYGQNYWENSEYIADGIRQPLIIHSEKAEAEKLKARWKAVGEEIKNTDSEFAGAYAKDGYRGWYLRPSPDNGFVYIFHYENIDIIDYSYGKIKIENSEIIFIPEREMQVEFRSQKLFTPKSWITFGNYLIPKDKIKDFANYLAGLGEYNDWNCDCNAFFSKITSSPNFVVPEQFKYLFKPPIEGKIISVGKPRLVKELDSGAHIETSIKVNIGRLNRVTKGMKLRIFQNGSVKEIIIYQVAGNYALGKISDFNYDEKTLMPTYFDSETEKYKVAPPIQSGTKVTTKLFSY